MPWILPLTLLLVLAFVLQHFLLSIAWGCVLAIATRPMTDALIRRKWSQGFAVTITTLALMVAFATPAWVLFTSLKKEVSAIGHYVQSLDRTGLPVPDWLPGLPFGEEAAHWWSDHLAHPGAMRELMDMAAGNLMPTFTSTLGSISTLVVSNAFYIFLAMLTMVIIHLNTTRIVDYLDTVGQRLMPIVYPRIRAVLPVSVRGTALGLCSVAILEGIVLGVAYWIAGAPMPALLGVITGYLALIPGGAPISFLSVSVLLLAQGNITGAVGLAIWGTSELFLVDKFVRPRIIGASVKLPFLAVLFGLIGGVSTLGVIGLFVGPFLMAMLFQYMHYEYEQAQMKASPASQEKTMSR